MQLSNFGAQDKRALCALGCYGVQDKHNLGAAGCYSAQLCLSRVHNTGRQRQARQPPIMLPSCSKLVMDTMVGHACFFCTTNAAQ